MTTFSQLVDDMTKELLRPDLRNTIVAFTNQTIRECHLKQPDGVAILFESNRQEVEWTVPSLPAVWPIPFVTRFQRMQTAFYKERNCLAKKKDPNKALRNGVNSYDPFWYRTGGFFAFNGINAGETVQIGYYEYPARLKYYPDDSSRPCNFNFETELYTYNTASNVNDTTRATARDLCTNWLLLRWGESVIKAGVRLKVFARLGDDTRAKLMYGPFENLRKGMIASESTEEDML